MSIDKRIVDMQFNNAAFEKGIGTTLSSLEQLKKSLDFDGGRGFDNLTKAAQGVDAGIEAIKVSFSALQIVGITVLSELTKGALNMGKQIVGSLTDPLISGGKKRAQNIEQAKFMFKGLGMDTEEAMKNSREAVLGTAYGLDEAARIAAQLGASGVELGNDMTTALKGIAGVAAMTSSDMTSIGSIFTTVAGQGKLMTMQLRQMENRGLNAAAVMGEAWGKTEAEVRDMITKGLVSFEMFSGAMSSKFGEHATKANEMYSGAISNMRSAFARIGADFYTPFYENMRQVINAFTPIVNQIHAGLKPVLNSMEQGMISVREHIVGVFEGLDLSDFIGKSIKAGPYWTSTLKGIYTQVEETGTLSRVMLSQMEISGIDAAGAIAKSMGKTNEEIREMISNGEITFEMFDKAMNAAGAYPGIILNSLSAIKNVLNVLSEAIKPVRDAFREIFPSKGTGGLAAFVENFKDLTEKFKIGEDAANNIKRTFKGVFAIFDIGLMGVKGAIQVLGSAISLLVGIIAPGAGGILDLTAVIGDFFVSLRDGIKQAEPFALVAEVISGALNSIKTTINGFLKVSLEPIRTFSRDAEDAFKPLTVVSTGVTTAFSAIQKVMEFVAPGVKWLGGMIVKAFGKMAEGIYTFISSLGDAQLTLGILNTLLLTGVYVSIKNVADRILKTIKDIPAAIGGSTFISMKKAFDDLRITFQAYQQNIRAKTLKEIAIAIGILAGSLWVLSTINPEKLALGVAGITTLFANLTGAMILMTQKSILSMKLPIVASGLTFMATAILILSFAMKNLAALDWEDLLKGLIGVGILTEILIKAADSIWMAGPKLIQTGISLIAFSTAILIMTQAVKQLGDLDHISLAKGLIGVGVLLGGLVIFLKKAKLEKIGMSSAVALIALGVALKIMASAVASFGNMDLITLAKGLGGVGVSLALLAMFTRIVDDKKLLGTGIAMIAVGAAMLLLSKAIVTIGSMKLEELDNGLLGMAVALGAVTAAVNFMPKNMIAIGIGLMAVSTAVLILSKALQGFGGMTLQQIANGLAVLGGALAMITLATLAMEGALSGAAAMIVISLAIGMLVPSLLLLGTMNLESVSIALLALAGIFGVIGAAAFFLEPLIPAILALAGAIFLLGLSALAIGAGLALFAVGLTSLSVAGVAGVTALQAIVIGMIELIPKAASALAAGLLEFIKVIGEGIPDIVKVIVELIMTLVRTLADNVPEFLEKGFEILMAILTGIRNNIQKIVVLGLEIVSEFLDGVANGLPNVINSAVNVVIEFLNAIGEQTPRIIDAGYQMVIDFLNGTAEAIRKNAEDLGSAFMNLGSAIIEGIILGMLGAVKGAVNGIVKVGNAIIDGFKSTLGISSPSEVMIENGKYICDGLIKGLTDKIPQINEAGNALGNAIGDGLSDVAGKDGETFYDTGEMYGLAFSDGMTNEKVMNESWEGGSDLSKRALEGAESNEGAFGEAGQRAAETYIGGLYEKAMEDIKKADKIVERASGGGYAALRSIEAATKKQLQKDLGSYDTWTPQMKKAYEDAGGPYNSLGAMEAAAKAGGIEIGKATVAGMTEGINNTDYRDSLRGAAYVAAKDAERAAQKALKIESPSKVFMEIGVQTLKGFIKGFQEETKNVEESITTMLNDAINKISNVVEDDVGSPTIRPVLDLNEIQNGINKISSFFQKDNDLALKIANDTISKRKNAPMSIFGKETDEEGGNVIFKQYNTSPKALSRTEIYRQTNNLVSQFKGRVVNPT